MPPPLPPRVRGIAMYLPQFHPIPENDEWWGPGFTEWTNVTAARPWFRGHGQPRLPADLGFYDLRVGEVRERQAELARGAGLGGFLYWHYWFGGRRLLERPFREVLASGRPEFGFCLGWANESWTGVWHGAPRRVLVEQTYPGRADHERHFEEVLPAFSDPRHLRVDGRPLFYVYRPFNLPDVSATLRLWREMACSAGLEGLHLVAETPDRGAEAVAAGFDAFVSIPRWRAVARRRPLRRRLLDLTLRRPKVVDATHFTRAQLAAWGERGPQYPCVVPDWDNTARAGRRGIVLAHATPERFRSQVELARRMLASRPAEHRLLFVKSWNEWAEGNHLEPDRRHGHAYLDALRAGLGAAA